MKKTIFSLLLFMSGVNVFSQDTTSGVGKDTLMLENIEVTSIRAGDKTPFTKTNLTRGQIEKDNLGYDLPYVLNQTPSVVAGSDAGNGVGYTNMRIRGSDATRINVTINGIPFNDAESQGTFFVNMPDIISSVSSLQIQRGAGTSSNGPGAFGASINLSTNEVNKDGYLDFNNGYGSFNTWKNTVRAGTGVIKKHFTIDGRFSNITSDGYIDRASSKLRSYYASAAYLNGKTSVRFNVISGREKTYQAWNGVPESLLHTERTYNSAGTEKPGTPYANETDNYNQTHYQLFLNQKVDNRVSFSIGAFLVRGKGYYENYKAGQKFSKYGLPDIINDTGVLKKTDLILQRWLDNYFYGSVFSGQYAHGKNQITLGGQFSNYDGMHFNRIVWAQTGIPPGFSSYHLPAYKQDFNIYAKWLRALGAGFNVFADVQQRWVDYTIHGFKDNPEIYIHKHYSFLNPKLGLSFLSANVDAYLSFSKAAKEPNREDFEAGITQIPRPEKLYDWEGGINYKKTNYAAGVSVYLMRYRDQLVNTGQINDVGAFTRTNAKKSYRAGVELQAGYTPLRWLAINANASFSSNKIKSFTEYIYDENEDEVQNYFRNTDISFSPDVIAGGTIVINPVKNGDISFVSKYVGNQFLDNTSNKSRMLRHYFVEDVRLSYRFTGHSLKNLQFIFLVNNVFNRLYEPNGYTYNYIADGRLQVENFYFPMAGINFMSGINLSL